MFVPARLCLWRDRGLRDQAPPTATAIAVFTFTSAQRSRSAVTRAGTIRVLDMGPILATTGRPGTVAADGIGRTSCPLSLRVLVRNGLFSIPVLPDKSPIERGRVLVTRAGLSVITALFLIGLIVAGAGWPDRATPLFLSGSILLVADARHRHCRGAGRRNTAPRVAVCDGRRHRPHLHRLQFRREAGVGMSGS